MAEDFMRRKVLRSKAYLAESQARLGLMLSVRKSNEHAWTFPDVARVNDAAIATRSLWDMRLLHLANAWLNVTGGHVPSVMPCNVMKTLSFARTSSKSFGGVSSITQG